MNIMNNNKKTWLISFCLLVGLAGVASTASAAGRQELQEMRSQSYSLISNVLIYYNPLGTPYDAANTSASEHDLAGLKALALRLSDAEVNERIKNLSNLITDLQHHLPQSRKEIRSVNPGYSRWLPQIIEQQDQLQQRLSQLYAQQPPAGEHQTLLHMLAHDLERLHLSYQVSSFWSLGADLFILNEQTIRALDASILAGLNKLKDADNDLSERLEQPSRTYRFARERAMNQYGDWAPNAVGRYLGSTVDELNLVARNLHH